MPRKFFVGGNWKRNGTRDTISKIVEEFNKGPSVADADVEVVIGVPFVYADFTQEKLRKDWKLSVQNCWIGKGGAFTGEVSAEMIKDAGIPWVILGHSERRHLPELKESDETVAIKVAYALANGLKVMACIGELLEEREKGQTQAVNERQLKAIAAKLKEEDWKNVVIAYEPVWAIGTGKVATPEQAQEVHEQVRAWVASNVSPSVAAEVRILYGGSVTAKNSVELAGKPDVDGFLVGGASLKPEFLDIVAAYKHK
uniref:Triosephosphate isomerase n=1 Tax=Euglena longa TaxID=3037 RepID=Q5S7Y4_EUGLO|nr:cytosolic triosephosphate isomerase [Euglena longa]